MTQQTDIFGGTKPIDRVQYHVDKIMEENVNARNSHGSLVWAYAEADGIEWIKDLPVGMKADLMRLFKVSPHIERAARKWKEHDKERQLGV